MNTETTTRVKQALLLILIAFGLSIGVAASCGSDKKEDKGGETASASAETPDKEEKEGEEKEEQADGEEIPADIYPGFEMGRVPAKERRKIVEIAKAELCPCPDANVSLHQCLQEEKTQCQTAQYAAVIIVNGLQESKTQTDILDDIATFVESVEKTYEFDLENTPVRGNPDAPVKLVEFADFQCPHCKQVVPIMKQISEKYGDKVAFHYKSYPLPFHPKAEMAARASLAAHAQGKFWPMHDLIYENQQSLSPAKMKTFARQIGLNMDKFVKDFEGDKMEAKVKMQKAEGEKANIDGTPTLFVNGKRYMGKKTVDDLSTYIDSILAGDKEEGAEAAKEADEKAE